MRGVEKAYYVGTKRNTWRAGKPLLILGIFYVTPKGLEPHPVFKVMDPNDNAREFIRISDPRSFKIISESDVREGRIPKATDDDDADSMEPIHNWFHDK